MAPNEKYGFTLYIYNEESEKLKDQMSSSEPLVMSIRGKHFEINREILPMEMNQQYEDQGHILPEIMKTRVKFIELKRIELPKKETMKKYRLVIPDMVPKEDFGHVNLFIEHDGNEINLEKMKAYSEQVGWVHIRSDIPKKWLHEIEDENVIAAFEYAKSVQDAKQKESREHMTEWAFDECTSDFEAGEHNNELRHRETNNKYSEFEKCDSFIDHQQAFITGWLKCNKSRGFND